MKIFRVYIAIVACMIAGCCCGAAYTTTVVAQTSSQGTLEPDYRCIAVQNPDNLRESPQEYFFVVVTPEYEVYIIGKVDGTTFSPIKAQPSGRKDFAYRFKYKGEIWYLALNLN